MKKSHVIAVIILVIGLIGSIAVMGRTTVSYPAAQEPAGAKDPVTIENGVQIINLTARGGYSPRFITAQAGIPTMLRVTTKSTFDCSAAFTIPSKQIQQLLPSSGVTEFDLGTNEAGKIIDGFCGMGMYSFKVSFK